MVNKSKLPQDVLLEIFDAYRQLLQLQPRYEHVWNSTNGWFKFTHVCRSWRRLVHLSPSRLHLHLLFTSQRSPRVSMLSRLPPFPILIDYSDAYWTLKEVDGAVAATTHRSRVRGITLHVQDRGRAKFLRALSLPFPELESLNIYLDYSTRLTLPATFLSSSAPSLRRLTLHGIIPSFLSPILSSATGLVELSLRPGYMSPLEPLLLTNPHRLPHLRRLELDLSCQPRAYSFVPPLPAVKGDVAPLSKLTHLIFKGHISSLESLVVGLAAPSLQHLTAKLYDEPQAPHYIFPIPHLCKFIRDSDYHFTTICLRLSFSTSEFKFFSGTVSQSVTDQPFNISVPRHVSYKQMGQELSGPLSTVKELNITRDWGLIQTDQWRGFFHHLPRLKVVRIPVIIADDVAHSFQKDDLEPALDLLPSLQRIVIERWVTEEDVEFARHSFGPLMVARERAGRPIGLDFS